MKNRTTKLRRHIGSSIWTVQAHHIIKQFLASERVPGNVFDNVSANINNIIRLLCITVCTNVHHPARARYFIASHPAVWMFIVQLLPPAITGSCHCHDLWWQSIDFHSHTLISTATRCCNPRTPRKYSMLMHKMHNNKHVVYGMFIYWLYHTEKSSV